MLRLALALALLLPTTTSAQAATNPWLARRVLNIAHQGGEAEFPSNTMYAFRHALKAGADMLELDVGVTKDGQVVVMHDTTLDRTTNGHGTIASHTLAQVEKLDAGYWFAGGADPYKHGLPARRYRFRGRGLKVPTLKAVLRAFPHTPINVEIKGRTKREDVSEYVTNAEALARLLKHSPRRDVIVVSFKQQAVDRFHALVPDFPLAPGIDGAAGWILNDASPGPGVVAFQLPITYAVNGQTFAVTTADNVARAHREGYAWHTWLSDDGESRATWAKLIDECVDGVMTAKPVAFERFLKTHPAPAACG
jgi:glycerophosphoryl diester phosphodiesterase